MPGTRSRVRPSVVPVAASRHRRLPHRPSVVRLQSLRPIADAGRHAGVDPWDMHAQRVMFIDSPGYSSDVVAELIRELPGVSLVTR